jgi:hypothetical protein
VKSSKPKKADRSEKCVMLPTEVHEQLCREIEPQGIKVKAAIATAVRFWLEARRKEKAA